MDAETAKTIAEATTKVVSKSIDNVVENLTDRPTKEIGKTLEDICFLVFGGLHQIADKRRMKYAHDLEIFEAELAQKVEQIPINKRIEPNLQTVGPSLEAAKYCIEKEELRKMFANLISSTMNSDTADRAHPSFAEIIRQITPLDAQNLVLFRNRKIHPLAEYIAKSKNEPGLRTLKQYIFLANPSNQNLTSQSLSISLLQRLGLITITYESWLADSDGYNELKNTSEFISYQTQLSDRYEIDIRKGMTYATPLGESFIAICLPKNVIVINK